MRIAIDAMGGDHAPEAVVEGAVLARRELKGVSLTLVGQEDKIRSILRTLRESPDSFSIVHADEVVTMDDAPSTAIRKKRKASMPVAIGLIKKGEADAVVSAGNTGALVGFALLGLRTLPGVHRPGFAVVLPALKKPTVLIDAGANIAPKPSDILEYAVMASLYSELILGKKDPTVALFNIGLEEEKGTPFIKETHKLLKSSDAIRYVGFIEGNSFYDGDVDIVVCDGFTGNAVLKVSEGLSAALMTLIRTAVNESIKGKIGALLAREAFRQVKRRTDMSEYGGVPLLGLDGTVIKCHGRADAKTVCNGIKVARRFVDARLNELIVDSLTRKLSLDRAKTA